MNWKNFWKNLLYPPLWVNLILTPLSIGFLVCSLVFLDEASVLSIISYVLATYTLTVNCLQIPKFIAFCKRVKTENKYLNKLTTDVHFRMIFSLYGSLAFNIAFAIFQLGLGFYHNSLWFFSMFAYYTLLAILRFLILTHTKKHLPTEELFAETKKYLLCGWLLLVFNLALSVVITIVVLQNKTFHHHEITTIALASYTFLTFTFAIINRVKYKKYNSPIYTSAKNISLITASVSILTLESTMLTTFGGNSSPKFNQIMLACTGFVVMAFSILVAISMIIKGSKNLKTLKTNPNNLNTPKKNSL